MDIQEWSMISYLSRVNYSYKGKYLDWANIQPKDSSSRFDNNKWGNFPSQYLRMDCGDKGFMGKQCVFAESTLKSYGILGNNNMRLYSLQYGRC